MSKITKPPIRYTSRDFDSIKQDLVSFIKRYYPDTFKDFQEAGFGSMVLDTTAYVGDILSFYLDYQVNESFLDTAGEFENVLKIAKQMGYKYQPNKTATGICSFYISVPAEAGASFESGARPNLNYAPTLRRGTRLSSRSGIPFILTTDVDFSDTNNEIVVATRDETTGRPATYAVKAFGRVISGQTGVLRREIGDYKPFQKVVLNAANIVEILSVRDSNNRKYYEVPNLAQDVIYRRVPNNGADKAFVKYLLQPYSVPRRFEVVREAGTVNLRFGYGSEADLNTANKNVIPSNKTLDLFGKDYITDTTFDPNTLLDSGKFGISPANTTITVIYRSNPTINVNVASRQLTVINRPLFKFPDTATNSVLRDAVRNSIEVVNEDQITGDVSPLTSDEIKVYAGNSVFAQDRAVTPQDYKALTFKMSSGLGSVKRAVAYKDTTSLKNNVDLYVLSEDSQGKLALPTTSLKNNLKNWLSRYKLINDSVDIFDAKVLNVKFDFIAVAEDGYDRAAVLARAERDLRRYLTQNPNDIGEPIYVTKLINIVNETEGVADVIRFDVARKTGTNYSSTVYDVEGNYSSDGRKIFIPKNVIWEVKFPRQDINGEMR